MKKIVFLFIFLYVGSLKAQKLDSLINYTYNNGQKSVGAKSYWEYDSELHAMKSSYYVYSREKQTFRHINDQFIKYYSGTKRFETFKTINYSMSRIDSSIYSYNADTINIKKVQYVGRLKHPTELKLHRVERYLDLNSKNRKTLEIIDYIKNGEISNSAKSTYEYVYNDKDELIEKIKYKWKDSTFYPVSKLIQTYTENGKIESVEKFIHITKSGQLEPLFTARFFHRDRERIQIKINHRRPIGDETKVEIEKVRFLNDKEKDILSKEFYVKSLSPQNLYREDIYYYSEE